MNILCPYCNSNNIELVEYVTEFITEYDCIECYKPFYVEDIIDKDDIIIRENRYSDKRKIIKRRRNM